MIMNDNQIAFSIYLDDWYHTPLITGSSFSIYKTIEEFFNSWNHEYDYITEPTLLLLDIFTKFKIRVTFLSSLTKLIDIQE